MSYRSSVSRPSKYYRPAILGAAVAASIAFALHPVQASPATALPNPMTGTAAATATAEFRGNLPQGGRYVLYKPGRWNGTVLIWNPGYGGGAGSDASAAPSDELRRWLLGQGYALAGTTAASGGWAVEELIANQPAVAAVIETTIGEPESAITWGASMGGLAAVAGMEAHPSELDAALPLCGSVAGAVPMLNGSLDGSFVLKTLLAPDDPRLELVNVTDEPTRQAVFRQVLDEAQTTPAGRARIALAATVAQIPVWTQPQQPEPSSKDYAAQQQQMYSAFMFGVISPRQPLEERAGGNFSWNTGVNYEESLIRSGNSKLVRSLYSQAGISLTQDLRTLAAGERISADPGALAYMQANATPQGELSGPVLTLHETGDTAPTVAQAGTYAARVRANGDNALLRQAFVDRPGHCNYSDAELAAAVATLQHRLDTGKWANLAHPHTLNRLADVIAERSGLERGGTFAAYKPREMLRGERED